MNLCFLILKVKDLVLVWGDTQFCKTLVCKKYGIPDEMMFFDILLKVLSL